MDNVRAIVNSASLIAASLADACQELATILAGRSLVETWHTPTSGAVQSIPTWHTQTWQKKRGVVGVLPGFRRVSARFRRVPPGSAGFPGSASPGFRRVPPALPCSAGFDWVLMMGSHLHRLRRFPPSPRCLQRKQLLKIEALFTKRFSSELPAQHCLPEGRWLLEQPCHAVKSKSTQQLAQSNAQC